MIHLHKKIDFEKFPFNRKIRCVLNAANENLIENLIENVIEYPAIATLYIIFGLEKLNTRTATRQRKKDHTKETHKVLKTGNQNYYKLIKRADVLRWPARSRSVTNLVMARLHRTIMSCNVITLKNILHQNRKKSN